jgi:hypothetical protein
MRKSLIALLAVLLCFVGSSCSVCRNSGKSEQEEVKTTSSISPEKFSPNVLIISYDAEVGKKVLLKAVKDYKAEIIYDYKIINAIAIRIPKDKTLDESITYFKGVKGVIAVEKDRILELDDPVRPDVEVM